MTDGEIERIVYRRSDKKKEIKTDNHKYIIEHTYTNQYIRTHRRYIQSLIQDRQTDRQTGKEIYVGRGEK